MISFGCDLLLEQASQLAGRRYGLLAHAASVTADLQPLHLALAGSAAGAPAALFGPEHGYYGVEQDMVAAAGHRDPLTGLPVVSLYGDDEASLRPRPEAFAGLEVLLIDFQDVGARYYTYAATAVWATEVALGAGVEVWVLDRPNPLGGERVEGDLPRPGYESFVGAFRIPVRHGLTLAELVRLELGRRDLDEDRLRIFPVRGWRRSMLWSETGRPWLAPSPNMPTPITALVYPGGCLIEATEISEGRGTTRPFQLIGAPGIDAGKLAAALTARQLPGLAFLPTYFRPQFQKHARQLCAGVEIVVTDPAALAPYRSGIELLAALAETCLDAFAWRAAPYEFVTDRPAIDLLTGGPELRQALAGEDDLAAWMESWGKDERAFREERREILLYPEETG